METNEIELNDIELIDRPPLLQFYRPRLLTKSLPIVLLTGMSLLFPLDVYDEEQFSLTDEPLHFDGFGQYVVMDENIMYYDEFLSQTRAYANLLPADENTKQYLEENTFYQTVLGDVREKASQYFSRLQGVSVFVQEDTKSLSVDLLVASPIAEALDCLDQFDAEWWLDYSFAGKDKVCLDVVSV